MCRESVHVTRGLQAIERPPRGTQLTRERKYKAELRARWNARGGAVRAQEANPLGTAKPPAPALLRSRRLRGEVVYGEYRVEGKVPYDVAFVVDRCQGVEYGVFVLAVIVAGLAPSFSSHISLSDALGEGCWPC